MKPMTTKSTSVIYEGLGVTIDEAVREAHGKIPRRTGKDFVVCRVLEWGFQRGGFVDTKQFYALVVEDEFHPLRTSD
jgi:hypothetical protein